MLRVLGYAVGGAGPLAHQHANSWHSITFKCGRGTPASHLDAQVQFNGVYYEPSEVAPAGQLQEGARYTFKYPRPER